MRAFEFVERQETAFKQPVDNNWMTLAAEHRQCCSHGTPFVSRAPCWQQLLLVYHVVGLVTKSKELTTSILVRVISFAVTD